MTRKALTGFAGVLIIYRFSLILFGELVRVVIIEAGATGELATEGHPSQPHSHPPAKHFHSHPGRGMRDTRRGAGGLSLLSTLDLQLGGYLACNSRLRPLG